MSYDLVAWPVDRAMSDDEAIAEIEKKASTWALGLGRDRRVDAFAASMKRAIPGLGTASSTVPMEFDVRRDWVHMALPWSNVAELIDLIAPIAFVEGLALFDPQRMAVALPPPHGAAPMGTGGVDQHERIASRAQGAITGSFNRRAGSIGDAFAEVTDALRAEGFQQMSPLGFEITPDIAAEVMADPLRVPKRLQTDERKADLLAKLASERAADRHVGLTMLRGWDPDPEVRAALLGSLQSDDALTVGLAAPGIARQRRPEDLPVLLEATHRMSPADGGTVDAMLMPLAAAFELAQAEAPHAVDDIRSKARRWRITLDSSRPRHSMSDEDFERMLDDMAAGAERQRY